MGFLLPKSSSNPAPTRLYGFHLQTALAGIYQSILYGTNRIAGNCIFAGPFSSHAVKSGSGKGAGGTGKGSGGGKDGDNADLYYTGDIIQALGCGPCVNILSVWQDKTLLKLNQITESFIVPSSGPYTYTPSQPSFNTNTGAARVDPYSTATNDYGNPAGPGTITGSQNTPMTPTSGSLGAGQYTPGTATAPTYTFSPADAGKQVTITYSFYELTDGTNGQPTTQLGLTFINGAIGQTPWGYLASNYASQAYGYSGLALVCSQGMNLGTDGNIPNFNYETQGQYCFGGAFPLDCNPADVIEDMLISPYYGVPGWSSDLLGDASEFSNYCIANGIFISPTIDQQQQASDWIQMFLTIGNGEAIWTDNVLKFRSYGDTTVTGNGATFLPVTAPIYDLDDNDYLVGKGNDESHSNQDESAEPLSIERTDVQDAPNAFVVTWNNRGNGYNAEPCPDMDDDAVRKYGRRDGDALDYPCITLHSVAQQVVNLAVKNSVYKRSTFKAKVGPQYALLEPMDMVTATSIERGINQYPIRITSVTENADYSIELEFETFPWGTAQPTIHPKQTVNPALPGFYSYPGDVNVPIFFEPPSEMTQAKNYLLLIALSGSYLWGGATVYVSRDGGTTYAVDGTQQGPSNMGALTADLAAGSDPDTTDTIHVSLSESAGELIAYTQAQADNFQSLILVDQELIAYTTATLVSTNNYTLSGYLRRGVYGTPITPHTSGAPVVALDGSQYQFQYLKADIGTTLFFKFASFNQFGQNQESVASATAYSRTIDGGEARPPFSLQAAGNPYPTAGSINFDSLGAVSAFSLTQSYQPNADGSAAPQFAITAKYPSTVFSTAAIPPQFVSAIVQPATSGGIVGTGQEYIIALCGYDSSEFQTQLSNYQSVTLPNTGSHYQIEINFIPSLGSVGVQAYIGTETDQLSLYGNLPATNTAILNVAPSAFTKTQGPPDPQANNVVFRARYEEVGGIVGTAISSITIGGGIGGSAMPSTITIANLTGFTGGALDGRTMTVLSSVQSGGVSKSFRRNMRIVSNTSTAIEVADSMNGFFGPPSSAGDAIAIRTLANPDTVVNVSGTVVTWVSGTQFAADMLGESIRVNGVQTVIAAYVSATSITTADSLASASGARLFMQFTIGDALLVNPYIPTGLGNVAGYFVRIIGGTGAGQERVISSNTPTVLTLFTGWDEVPDSDSVFVVLSIWQPDYVSPPLLIAGVGTVTTSPISLNIPNIPAVWYVEALMQDTDGNRSDEATAPWLEFFAWGNPGTSGSTSLYVLAEIASNIATIDLSLGSKQEIVGVAGTTITIADPINYTGNPTFQLFLLQDSTGASNWAFGPHYIGVDPTQFGTTAGLATVLTLTVKSSTQFIISGQTLTNQALS